MVTYSDTFAGTNGSPLGTTEVGGATWLTLSGTWTRTSGKAATSAAVGSNPLAVIDAAVPDVDMTLTVSPSGGDALYFRVVDASNWLRVRIDSWQESSYSPPYWDGTYDVGSWVYTGTWTGQPGDDAYTVGDHYYWHWDNDSPYANSWVHTTSPGYGSRYERTVSQHLVGGGTVYYNYYRAILDKCVAGTVTTLKTYSVSNVTSIRVITAGTFVSVFLNGVQQTGLSESTHATATKFGLGKGGSPTFVATNLDQITITPANVAPLAPTLLGPVTGSTINVAATNRFTWQTNDPDAGDTPSKYDLQFEETGSGIWTTVTNAVPTSFWDASAGTFTAATEYEWQVRTYDRYGFVGPWSTSSLFTGQAPPDGPSITAPVNGGTVSDTATLTWSTAETQTAFQVRRVADNAGVPDEATVYFDSAEVADATNVTRAFGLSFTVNGRYEHLQLRIKADGLWSVWVSIRVLVSYTPPGMPTFTLTADDSTLVVTITNPTPQGGEPTPTYNEVWVKDTGSWERRVTNLAPSTNWRYWTPISGVDYDDLVRIITYGSNGTVAQTDTVAANSGTATGSVTWTGTATGSNT